MNYWHMQLHPDNLSWKKEEDLLNQCELIGLGDWEKGKEQINNFKNIMEIGDIVLIKSGSERIALVEVIGQYEYEEHPPLCKNELDWFPHRRKIKILEMYDRENDFPQPRGTLNKAVNKNTDTYKLIDKLYKNYLKRIKMKKYLKVLQNNHQIILQGPPGTGKTRLAKIIAVNLINGKDVLCLDADEENIKREFRNIKENAKIIQFHPSYSYEDFVRGIVAKTTSNGISYEVENKILAQMAKKALENPEEKFVLIIDDINRANLSAVLGELIYALEYRGEAVESMYELNGSRKIVLPENLYIIGTMNTADRSVGHIDYAIRRRFTFINILPEKNIIKASNAQKLFEKIEKIFNENHLSPEFDKNDVMIGHSYFLSNDLENYLEYKIKPLLLEYVKDGVLKEEVKEEIENLSV